MDEFNSSRKKLNFRPNIQYVEPDQIILEDEPEEQQEVTIDEIQSLTDELIAGYQDLDLFAKEAQKRIDELVGNYVINLDTTQDSHVIDALKRMSGQPDDGDNSLENETSEDFQIKSISYEDYKSALDTINNNTNTNYNTTDQDEMNSAAVEPFRNTFGGMEKAAGLRRPELEKTNQPIKPININKFKKNMVLKLFNMLKPMISKLAIKLIKKLIKKPF